MKCSFWKFNPYNNICILITFASKNSLIGLLMHIELVQYTFQTNQVRKYVLVALLFLCRFFVINMFSIHREHVCSQYTFSYYWSIFILNISPLSLSISIFSRLISWKFSFTLLYSFYYCNSFLFFRLDHSVIILYRVWRKMFFFSLDIHLLSFSIAIFLFKHSYRTYLWWSYFTFIKSSISLVTQFFFSCLPSSPETFFSIVTNSFLNTFRLESLINCKASCLFFFCQCACAYICFQMESFLWFSYSRFWIILRFKYLFIILSYVCIKLKNDHSCIQGLGMFIKLF